MIKSNRAAEEISYQLAPKPLDKPKMFDKKIPLQKEQVQSILKKMSNAIASSKLEDKLANAAIALENTENTKTIGISSRIPNVSANSLTNQFAKSGKEELLEILSVQNNGLKNNSGLMQRTESTRMANEQHQLQSDSQQLSQRAIEGLIKSQKMTYFLPTQKIPSQPQSSNIPTKPKIETKHNLQQQPQPQLSVADLPHYSASIEQVPLQDFNRSLQKLKPSGSQQQLQSSSVFGSSSSNQYKPFLRAQTNNFFNEEGKSFQLNQITQLSSSTGFTSSALKSIAKKPTINSQSKLMSNKKLFEAAGNSRQEIVPSEKQKSSSLQRFSGPVKPSHYPNQHFSPPIGQNAMVEYFSKLQQTQKGKNDSILATMPSEQTTDPSPSSQFNSYLANNKKDKTQLDKEVEEVFLDTIQQINKEIQKKKPLEEIKPTSPQPQILSPSVYQKQQTEHLKTQPIPRSSPLPNFMKKESKLSDSYSQKQIDANLNQKSFLKKSESFRIPTQESHFKKSNSLNKRDPPKSSAIQSIKQAIKPPTQPSAKKYAESPATKPSTATKAKSNISQIFKNNVRSSLQATTLNQRSMNLDLKNGKQVDMNYKALTMGANPSKQFRKSESASNSPYTTNMNSSLNTLTLPQTQEYLLRPPMFQESIDFKQFPLQNRKSDLTSDSPPLRLSDLDTLSRPEEVISRKRRIETPINVGFCYYNTSMDMHSRFPNDDDYNCRVFLDHFEITYNTLHYFKKIPPADPLLIESKLVDLPINPPNRKTIIFDLDETLIHSFREPTQYCDVVIPFTLPDGEQTEAYVNIRPYARECLRELSKYFEIIIFTASQSCYAEKIIDFLDPKKQFVDYRLSKDSCLILEEEGIHVKDLRILKNRNLKDVVIVDNAAYSFGFQIDNGIPIIPFIDNKRDMELKYLVDFLKQLIDKEDVRPYLHKIFKLFMYADCPSKEVALEKVYAIRQTDIALCLPSFIETQQDEDGQADSDHNGLVQPFQQYGQQSDQNIPDEDHNIGEEDSGLDFEREDFSDIYDSSTQ